MLDHNISRYNKLSRDLITLGALPFKKADFYIGMDHLCRHYVCMVDDGRFSLQIPQMLVGSEG